MRLKDGRVTGSRVWSDRPKPVLTLRSSLWWWISERFSEVLLCEKRFGDIERGFRKVEV